MMPGGERMDQEQKKFFKKMSFGKKAEYLWMYYKGVFAAVLLVICAVWLGITMYRGRHTVVALNVFVAGGDARTAEWIEEDFTSYEKLEGEEGVVRIKAGLPEAGDNMTTKTALTTLMGAEAVDVLVCAEDIYTEYHEQGGFEAVREITGEDTTPGDALVLGEDNVLTREGQVGYQKVYAAVPVNCQNREMAARFLDYLKNR